jgi:hypothetical protein
MNWSLLDKNKNKLKPLIFSNGKSQEDIVNEVLNSITEGNKVIFLKGICGSGKSAIALNIARKLGKASIVVPVKYLQKQYEEDYMNNFSILKDDGNPLNIQILTGRNNFDCIYSPGCKADDNFLPCTIDLKNDNWDLIKSYIKNNKSVNPDDFDGVDDVRRISVAAACSHWSPVIGKEWFGDYGLKDAKQYKYKGLKDKEYVFFKREAGCKYYEQFMSYVNADVLVFNSRKYEVENIIDRKPATDVEIIDECDEFLDNLSNEKRLNINFMKKKLEEVWNKGGDISIKDALESLIDATNKILNAKWVDEMVDSEEILEIKDTPLRGLFGTILVNDFLLEHEELENYYAVAKNFQNMMEDTYVRFENNPRGDIIAKIVNINLEKKLKEILDKNKVFIMMSGTLHSEKVLKDIFGLTDFVIVEAETKHGGLVKKKITGYEKSCRWRDFKEGRISRKEYLETLNKCINAADKPFLVHVNSFADLPSNEEKEKYGLDIMSSEKLIQIQDKYRHGELLQMFKEGKLEVLYSTKCNRGVDLPGNVCNSILFTRYPFPAMHNIFWKILQKKYPTAFREFYFDKSKREFIQRIYRGLRKNDDVINLLSPDSAVIRSKI